jgi:hypothetical protein
MTQHRNPSHGIELISHLKRDLPAVLGLHRTDLNRVNSLPRQRPVIRLIRQRLRASEAGLLHDQTMKLESIRAACMDMYKHM